MTRLALAALGLLLMLVPLMGADAQTTPGPLLNRYGANASNGVDAYRPRSFTAGLVLTDVQRSGSWKIIDSGSYDGWDVFAFGGVGGSFTAEVSNAWATFQADRDVTVGYVHRQNGAPPPWIAADGWTLGDTVDAKIQDSRGWTDPRPVYTKTFPAGTVTIKSPSQDGKPTVLPWMLFAEGDGTPSLAPSAPAGRTVPVPNQQCPDWVHDEITTSTLGGTWATWHGPVNPKYWCYYGHEHGSNPALVYGNDSGRLLRFGEVAEQMSMKENHWGHKVYAIEYADVDMLMVHHFGTYGLGRINTCAQQHHLVEVHIRNKAHTETLYAVRFMADYGRSLGTFVQEQGGAPLNPDICPNGNAVTEYTGVSPSRQVPVQPFGFNPAAPQNDTYEPWVFRQDAYRDTLGLAGNFVFNTVDPLTVPADTSGNVATEVMHRSGTGRFFTPNTMAFRCPAHANAQGYWWTDAMAHHVVPSTTPGAVRQFCKPGWEGVGPIPPFTPESAHRGGKNMARWGDWAMAVPGGEPGDFEGSIARMHGPN